MLKVGERVGAVSNTIDGTVYLYGYGVYVGSEVPPDGPLHKRGTADPKIILDDGGVVWGYQCWIWREETIKAWIGDRTVSIVAPK